MPDFQPFVPADQKPPEFTLRAILLGCFFGVIFGAVTVYVGLRAGLTVAASIPIAVLSISILRAFGRASILENNIVQTTGNAGQSIASGVIFTLPALVFLGFDLEYSRIFMLALIGGWLGVLFMIPLRRQLIVQEHGVLPYPEGTACADVLIAGEKGGSLASRVFLGLGLGGLYTFLQNKNLFSVWPGSPEYQPDFGPQHVLKGASINADATSEYLGVGYIIGSRVAGIIFAGGVFSWLVIMPLIYFFGKALPNPVYPGQVPIGANGPQRPLGHLHQAHGRRRRRSRRASSRSSRPSPPSGARSPPASRTMRPGAAAAQAKPIRTEDDLSMRVVLIGSLLIVVCMFIFLEFKPVPGAFVGWAANLAASLLVVVFGFLFVTVSSRIVGLVGSSASPVSGMTIATLMATAAVFLVQGWTAPAFGALAITIGGVVCIAASNSGDTSQDLKTGYIIGSTPRLQQIALMIGVVVSTVVIGFTLNLMNTGLQEFHAASQPWDINAAHPGVAIQSDTQHTSQPDPRHRPRRKSATFAPEIRVHHPQRHRLNRASGRQISLLARHRPHRGALDSGHRLRQRARAAGPAHGHRHQRHPQPQASLGTGSARRLSRHRRRVARHPLAHLRRRRLSAHRHHAAHLLRRRGPLARRRSRQARRRIQRERRISPGSLFASGLIAAGGIAGLIGVALKAVEATYYDNRDLLNLPAHLPRQQLCLGAGLRGAGLLALLLREEAAEEVTPFCSKPLIARQRVNSAGFCTAAHVTAVPPLQ